jgi:hypothetical protein
VSRILWGLWQNAVITVILLSVSVTEPNPRGMLNFWGGLLLRIPHHLMNGIQFLWNVAPLW